MALRGNKTDRFNEECGKVDNNKYVCEFEKSGGEGKGQVAVRASRDGQKEVMKTSFDELDKEEKAMLIEETKNRVNVSSNETDSPFDGKKE